MTRRVFTGKLQFTTAGYRYALAGPGRAPMVVWPLTQEDLDDGWTGIDA